MPSQTNRIFGKSFQFPKAQLEKLFEYILIDDVPRFEAPLPKNPSPLLTEEMIHQDWGIAYALLRDYYDPKVFRKLVWKIIWHEPDKEGQRKFKDIRARFKNLRHAFTTFDKDHHYPSMIHILTFFMGELQDAYKTHYALRRMMWGFLLWFMLNPICNKIFQHQISSIVTVTPEELTQFHNNENDQLKEAIQKPELTGTGFHKLRKIISRRAACFDCLRALYPNDDLNILAARLATINGLMGDYHDTLVEKRLAKTQDYYKDLFEWPEEVKKYITVYLQHVDSIPPKQI